MFSPYEFGQVMAGFCNAVRAAPPSPLDGVPNQLEQLLRENRTMSENMTKLLDEQAQLRADVTAQTTVINSATTALVGLAKQLAVAEGAAKAAGGTDEQIAGFTNLRTTLESNTALLAAAIPANTPAAVSTETGAAITTESGTPPTGVLITGAQVMAPNTVLVGFQALQAVTLAAGTQSLNFAWTR